MKKDWIKRLPPGEYTMRQIKEFAGLASHASIKIVMIKYGAKVKKIQVKSSNFFMDIFIWKGFKPIKKERKK